MSVIVVGGGLAGVSAALTVLENNQSCLLLDKKPFLGGNSVKATSGANGAGTRTQKKLGIADSVEAFVKDTTKSARDLARPDLINALCGNSASAIHWLTDKFDLDLSIVSRLGGHSFERTHRGKERFPGAAITQRLIDAVEDAAKRKDGSMQVVNRATVKKLLKDGDKIVGVVYETKDGASHEARGTVILSTGGYGADFSENSLLKTYRPDLMHLSTTNGDHTTGDGIKMAKEAGAGLVDIEVVQVHPTGIVDPSDPNSKVKWLAAEALRGVGGILLDANGRRFVNELGHRDFVSGEMQKNKGPFRLVLNSGAARDIKWHVEHYEGRKIMTHYRSGAELAAAIGCDASTLADTFEAYTVGAANHDDEHGRLYFSNAHFQMDDEFHVAIVTPVVHYCMGGLEVAANGAVLSNGKAIEGLYAAGEVMGGVHGRNRLGGSSLLDCLVFGRIAGAEASARAARVGGGGANGARITVTPGANNSITIDIAWAGGNGAAATQASSGAVAAAGGGDDGNADAPRAMKVYTAEEVAKHNTEDDCWVIVGEQVLQLEDFLDDHPGGKAAIMAYAGKDATKPFDMLHSKGTIEKYAEETIIGTIAKAKL